MDEANLCVDVVNNSKSINQTTEYPKTNHRSPVIEEQVNTPHPEEEYQYLFNEAKYVDNGSINLVSGQRNPPLKIIKSNEDLEENEKEEIKVGKGNF